MERRQKTVHHDEGTGRGLFAAASASRISSIVAMVAFPGADRCPTATPEPRPYRVARVSATPRRSGALNSPCGSSKVLKSATWVSWRGRRLQVVAVWRAEEKIRGVSARLAGVRAFAGGAGRLRGPVYRALV
jgi:hypothetical protein